MSGFISITIDRSLADQLARAAAEAADLRPAMAAIASVMRDDTVRRFQAQVAPGGVPWKRSQRAIEDGGKTLQDKGFLIASLGQRHGPEFAEVGVESGVAAPYAAIHQFGGTIVPKNKKALSFGGRVVSKVVMPARPYLGFDPDTIEDIREVLAAHLRRAFGQSAQA